MIDGLRKIRFRGFTLLEVTMVIGLLAILFAIGSPVTIDFVRRYSVQSERDALITLLEWAREQSLTNVDQNSHGIRIETDQFIGFTGVSYATRDQSQDLSYPKSSALSIAGPSEIVFQSLTGKTSDAAIILDNGAQQYTVTINEEGMIDW